MVRLKFGLAVLSLVAASIGSAGYNATRQPGSPAAPGHMLAGDQVQERYQHYVHRLNAYDRSLLAALRANAPESLSSRDSHKPLQQGYQMVPRIITDPPVAEHRPASAWYSWPWTDSLIERELTELGRSETALKRAIASRSIVNKSVYESLSREYRRLQAAQHNIDAHIQYNRFWQEAIARDRPGYDRETHLHEMVIERRAINNALEVAKQASKKRSLSRLRKLSGSNRIAVTKHDLMDREKRLAHAIEQAAAPIIKANFVDVENRDPHLWIVHVPVYTDIEDEDFLARVKEAVETIWRLRDGAEEFRVELAITSIPVKQLYQAEKVPETGEPLNLDLHLARFPANGAILTTGAIATHVYRRAIVLAAQDITPRVLAHEFGHILGFRDNYFRGYRDLGDKGFQVVETVADTTDIMGDPVRGSVLRSHFERILEAVPQRETAFQR